jgi:hypothetical protein
MFAALTSTDT